MNGLPLGLEPGPTRSISYMSFSTDPPIDILPSEILSHVFVLGHTSLPATPNFEVSVSHVSRRWRAISIGTQELWGVASTSMPLDRVSTYVDRSKAHTLAVSILQDFVREDPHDFPELLDRFLQITEGASARWNRLFIWTYSHTQMKLVLDRVFHLSVPRLEFLQLVQDTNHAPSAPIISGEVFQNFFTSACSLNIARFQLVYLPWMSFSAANLREMDIGGLSRHIRMDYAQLRQVMTASRSLVKLALMGAFPDVESHVAYPLIVLPALETLHISSLDPEHTNLSILHLLSTPVLKSLEIVGVADLNTFFSDVNTSPPKYPLVTSLKLRYISTPLQKTDVISAFPNLSQFEVSGSTAFAFFADWSFQVLNRVDKSVFWPNLQTLTIDKGCARAPALTRIVKWRSKYGKPLTMLRMTDACRDGYSALMMNWLNEKVTVQIILDENRSAGIQEEYEVIQSPEDGENSAVETDFSGVEFNPYEEMYDPNDPAHIQRDMANMDNLDNLVAGFPAQEA